MVWVLKPAPLVVALNYNQHRIAQKMGESLMKSESKSVPKERVIIYMSKEQAELAAEIASIYGWDVPDLHRMAHCLGLTYLTESGTGILMNRKLKMKTDISKMLHGLSPEDLAKVLEFIANFEKSHVDED